MNIRRITCRIVRRTTCHIYRLIHCSYIRRNLKVLNYFFGTERTLAIDRRLVLLRVLSLCHIEEDPTVRSGIQCRVTLEL